MKSVSTIIFFIMFINIKEISTQNINGNRNITSQLRVERFNPCPDNFITMVREIGRQPPNENYWDGTVHLKNFGGLPEARIAIRLTQTVVATVDENDARVYSNGYKRLELVAYDPNEDLKFTVLGSQGKPFPNIIEAYLNGKKFCNDSIQITPTIINPDPVIIASNAIPLQNFISYCGRPQIKHTELILKGNFTKYGEWPWHVAIYSRNGRNSTTLKYICGGSIISSKSILTAAHCIVDYNDVITSTDNLVVSAGRYDLNTQDPWAQQRDVVSIKLGDGFSRSTLRNDIAILQLNEELKFNQYIQRVCLWNDYEYDRNTSKYLTYGVNGIIPGWGTNEDDEVSEKLMTSKLQIVSDTDCLLSYPTFFRRLIYHNSICAGPIVNGTGPCNGDSGGGLVIPIRQVDNENSYFLRGIVSVTVSRSDKKLCDPDFYTIFTDAAQLSEWIEENDI